MDDFIALLLEHRAGNAKVMSSIEIIFRLTAQLLNLFHNCDDQTFRSISTLFTKITPLIILTVFKLPKLFTVPTPTKILILLLILTLHWKHYFLNFNFNNYECPCLFHFCPLSYVSSAEARLALKGLTAI